MLNKRKKNGTDIKYKMENIKLIKSRIVVSHV